MQNEFKIFTNINSTIVDPKEFDPNSFVEFESDHCTFSHSALARTVEFKIHRNILPVCSVNLPMQDVELL